MNGLNWVELGVFSAIAYLVGAIPFSFLFAKVLKGIDLREFGSGNLGSTNAIRALGLKVGLAVQALDIAKGWLPTMLPLFVFGDRVLDGGAVVPMHNGMLLVGVFAVLGHMFPVYLKFRGGKGVNTSIGVFLALAPNAVLATLVVGLTLLAITRLVSLCSMTGSVVLVFAIWYFYPDRTWVIIAAALVSALVIVMHRSNIKRLLAGTESRIGRVDLKGELHERSDKESEA